MDQPTDVSIERLREALAAAEGGRATLRVVARRNDAADISPSDALEVGQVPDDRLRLSRPPRGSGRVTDRD